MRKCFVLSGFLFVFCLGILAQEAGRNNLPAIELKDIDGKSMNTSNFSNQGKPFIISFFATWCKPCLRELSTIHEVYEDWIDETGVKLIAVSIDDTRSSANVKTLVNGKGWEYEVFLDPNGAFKRAMNVNNIPHTFIIDGSGKIAWQHTSFSQGSENEMLEVVKKLMNND
ncbi:thiol-disulfide oxidoreductase ResA [Bacteroidales bacterium]|nr:thiol-disulfide oxidoreductase ResA [Bacteroidales bacterium]